MARHNLKPIQTRLSSETTRICASPFVKWVGGKRSILPELTKRLPCHYSGYHELFVGGGALFFAVQPQNACLSDINLYLILTFHTVKNQVQQLLEKLQYHAKKHSKEYYLECRKRISKETDSVTIAGLFIYLNKTCFNGLYRVNKAGNFNVPMGDYEKPHIMDQETLIHASELLKSTVIEHKSFEHVTPQTGHFYYLDPPYHQTYTSYSETGFTETQHTQLAGLCEKIDQVGGYFMVSNSDTPFVRELYKKYNIEKVFALRTLSCQASQRGRQDEVIIRNYD